MVYIFATGQPVVLSPVNRLASRSTALPFTRLSAASAARPIARIEAGLPSLTLKLISCARFWLRFGLATGASRANSDGKWPKKSNSSRKRWKCPEVSDEPA